MKKNVAYIIDPYSHGNYHEVINQGYLMMICALYDKVVYIAEKDSSENLRNLFSLTGTQYDNVEFRETKFKRLKFKWAGLDYLSRLLFCSWYCFVFYMKTKKDTDVFYNNNIFFAIWLIQVFAKRKQNRIFDLCHSEMEWADSQFQGSRLNKLVGKYFRWIFSKNLDRKFKFFLMSPRMVDHFKNFVSEKNYSSLEWIDHCYIRPQIEIDEARMINDSSIKIGVPGLVSANRGLSELKCMLNQLKDEKIKIYALSLVKGSVENSHFVELNKTGKLFPIEIYNGFVQQMDALVLFYSAGSYKLTASGAVLEAIWNEKPIFAVRNEYFEYLFDKFGSMGFLCDSAEELGNKLNRLDCLNLEEYKNNLKKAKQMLHPQNVSWQLKSIVEKD